MTNLQLFFAIVGVMSAEIAVVLAFTFHGFSDLKRQINRLSQYMVDHEGRISALEDRQT